MEKYLSDFSTDQKELIHILHRVQAEYGYVPPHAISAIATHLKISESEIYGVLTFYNAFSLEPRGEHVVTVCMGTACHVRGAPRVLDTVQDLTGIKPGETDLDLKFSLETVNCLGCCALGPVIEIDGKTHGKVSRAETADILTRYE